MLTNEVWRNLQFSEAVWIWELQIKDCGHEIIQNWAKANKDTLNKLPSEKRTHTSPSSSRHLLREKDGVLSSVPSPGQDQRD